MIIKRQAVSGQQPARHGTEATRISLRACEDRYLVFRGAPARSARSAPPRVPHIRITSASHPHRRRITPASPPPLLPIATRAMTDANPGDAELRRGRKIGWARAPARRARQDETPRPRSQSPGKRRFIRGARLKFPRDRVDGCSTGIAYPRAQHDEPPLED
jgi:hypothetical protein